MKPELLQGSTMRFGRLGRTYVCIHSAFAPTDTDWKAFVTDLERQAHQITGVFVYSENGAGPNALQRKQVAEMWARAGGQPAIAVVTKSPGVRAMITALNYFLSRPIREFSPQAVDKALDHLGVVTTENHMIRRLISMPPTSIEMASTRVMPQSLSRN